MNTNKVDMFLMGKGHYFSGFDIPFIQSQLENAPDEKWIKLMSTNFQNPTIMLIVSFLGGMLGIDRFMIGDTGLGIGKLLTCGGFGIWSIIDLFLIMDATKRKNIEKFNIMVA